MHLQFVGLKQDFSYGVRCGEQQKASRIPTGGPQCCLNLGPLVVLVVEIDELNFELVPIGSLYGLDHVLKCVLEENHQWLAFVHNHANVMPFAVLQDGDQEATDTVQRERQSGEGAEDFFVRKNVLYSAGGQNRHIPVAGHSTHTVQRSAACWANQSFEGTKRNRVVNLILFS